MMRILKGIGGGGGNGVSELAARAAMTAVSAAIDAMNYAGTMLEKCGAVGEPYAKAFRTDADNLVKRRNVLRQKLGAR